MENGLLGFAGQGPAINLDPNTQLFISSGVWTKPADCQWVRVIIVGGGGGGAGGGKGTINTGGGQPTAGGAGGAGGGTSFIDLPAGLLPSTVTVTIGAGGASGAGSTTDDTMGSSSGGGGNSSFGDFLIAYGGSGTTNNDTASGGAGSGGTGLIQGGQGSVRFFGSYNNTFGGYGTYGGGSGANAGYVEMPASSYRSFMPFSEPQQYGVIGQGGQGGAANIFGTRPSNASPGTFGSGGGGGGGGKSLNNGESGGAGGDGFCLVVSYGTPYRPINVQEFTTSGVWQKPIDPRLKVARVFAIAGGGGGGSGRRWDHNNGAYLTGSRLALSSAVAAYASTPDSAALSITGDIDIVAKIAAYSWCESIGIIGQNQVNLRVVNKWNTSSNQRSYSLQIRTDGLIFLQWSTTGANELSFVSTESLDLQRNDIKWIRATLDVDNGSSGRTCKFYSSDDGSSWTQLGTTQTTAGTTSIFDSTAVVSIGTAMNGASSTFSGKFEGSIYQAKITNGYDGAGTVQFNANFETAAAGAASFTESSANAATVTITNVATTNFGGAGGAGGAVCYSEIPLAVLPNSVDVTVGLGGTGGAGITENYGNGAHGTQGGDSLFGSFVAAMGGSQGFGGNSVIGRAGYARKGWANNNSTDHPFNLGSLAGGGAPGRGGSTTGSNSTVVDSYNHNIMTQGGGGGAGINSSGTAGAGGTSAKPAGYGSIMSDVTASGNGSALLSTTLGIFGSVGGGGGSSNGSTSVNGGNGVRGSGGGGGAATTTGTTSGAGGNGGDGYVLVICV